MIKKSLIILESPLDSMEKIIKELIEKAFEQGLLNDKDSFYQSVQNREKQVSTAIGYGIAIPHGKDATVKEPFVAYLRVQKAFNWDSNKDEDVKSVFLMGLPDSNSDAVHLKFLAEISKKLMDESFREALNHCKTKNDAFVLLNEVNKRIGGEL